MTKETHFTCYLRATLITHPSQIAQPLRLHAVTKAYGELNAVDALDLEVEAGQLFTLLGPSGCGKTTTLKLIAGLLEPDSGSVHFGHREVTHLPPERRNLGLVFQRYALFPHLNVAANVAFGLKMRGVNKVEQRRRVAEVLDAVQLTGLERRFPSQLSGGQQQRVAIARTVVTRPEVLLLDEPLSNLDASLREELRGFIRSLQQRLGVTTVFVTHDQVEALELSDRVGVMLGGRLAQVGTPAEVFERPATVATARFMGGRNFLEVSGSRAEGWLETPLGWLHTQAGRDTGTLSIRPEQVEVSAPSEALTENSFPGTVLDAKYRGGSVLYTVNLGPVSLSAQGEGTRRYHPGESVTVTLPAEHLWLLPPTEPLTHPLEKPLKETE